MKIIHYLLFVLSMSFVMTSCGQSTNKIPLFITPIYNHDPLTINVGEFSDQLLSLNIDNYESRIDYFKEHMNMVSIEAIYVLSVRLYDIGKKKEAAYWFYTAQARGRVFSKMLDQEKSKGIGNSGFELKQIFSVFNQLAGEYINGYIGGDIDEWLSICKRVHTEMEPIETFTHIYPKIAFLDDSKMESIVQGSQEGLQNMIKSIDEGREEIIKQRKLQGTDGKY